MLYQKAAQPAVRVQQIATLVTEAAQNYSAHILCSDQGAVLGCEPPQ